MTTIKLSGGCLGSETMRVRCNLAEASAPVQVDYGTGNGWESTQYQCADCRHTNDGLAAIGQRLAMTGCELTGDDDEVSVYVAAHSDEDEHDTAELRRLFALAYGREPDEKDEVEGLWSHIVASVDETECDWEVVEPATVYVVRDAAGEYIGGRYDGQSRTPASDEATEFETRVEAEAACDRATDSVIPRTVEA